MDESGAVTAGWFGELCKTVFGLLKVEDKSANDKVERLGDYRSSFSGFRVPTLAGQNGREESESSRYSMPSWSRFSGSGLPAAKRSKL